MTKFIVHLYREMRLSYTDIEADTPEAAAGVTRDRPTGDACDIDDCEGETLAALVDTAGDEDYSQSVTIDFEAERIRKAAPKLLDALEGLLSERLRPENALPFTERDVVRIQSAERKARDIIAEAKAAGIIPSGPAPAKSPSRFEIEHDPEENPDRAYVLVDGTFDVAIIRTAEGIVIDVYPKDWIDPIDTMTIWDDEVAPASAEAEADDAGEA